jgi:hypothetical protein
MIQDYFRSQIDYYPALTSEVLNKAEYKTVWSGKQMTVGDKVLFAFVYVKNTNDLKAITFLERELDEIATLFNFIRLDKDIPILSFKDDKTKR